MLIGSAIPAALPTPTTVVLLDRLERNLSRMAGYAAENGFALRPHAKTHKCPQIVKRQLALGATGITVATIGEAEILAADHEGLDLFIAYPLWAGEDSLRRLAALAENSQLTVGTDSAEAADRLAPLAGQVRVMVEVDCGLRRSGVPPAQAGAVAQAAHRSGIEVAGVFTFPGHSYAPRAARSAAADEAAALVEAAQAMAAVGHPAQIRSGGSTPSARVAHPDAVTELRPGVYVFNDAQQVELGATGFDDVALFVAATVVSRSSDRLVLDAGAKVLSPDRAGWASGYGRLPDWPEARITGLWEHHAVVSTPGEGPALGDKVAVIPNHVCSAVNLVPELQVAEGGRFVDRWPVAARGANR